VSRPTFPETPIADDRAWLAEQGLRAILAAHWRPGWLRDFIRDESGRIVRIGFRECDRSCPCREVER
jgi:hypothetical protein